MSRQADHSRGKAKQAGGAKRKSTAKTTRSTAAAAKIARIDSQLVRLLQRRADAVLAAQRRGVAVESGGQSGGWFDAEAARLLAVKSKGPMPAGSIVAVIREAADNCRSLLLRPRVAFSGQRLGIAHLAALRHFGGSAECLPVDGVAAVLDELARRQSEFGLIPLGNSVESRVAADFDAVVRGEMKLCGIVRLALHYAVLGKCSRGEVREVYGEPAALPRCRSWLAVHLPTARTVEVTSASTACRLADEKPGAAAVAAREWAAPCKLDVLADKIETHPAGSACFAVIGEQIPPRTKNDCTAILLQVDNRPGGLADALGVLKRNKVNLSRIESLPAENCDKHAIFFVEIAGHAADKRLGRKLESLRRKTTRLEILGSYPTPGPVD